MSRCGAVEPMFPVPGWYCLGKVSTAGNMWVSRDRIRLSNKSSRNPSCRGDELIDPYFEQDSPETAANFGCAIM
jgi:hypothetical protein